MSANLRDPALLKGGLALFLLGSTACGSSSSDLTATQFLKVAMMGVFEAPPTASGNAEPKFLTFTLEGVTITSDDGEVVDLFAATDPITEPIEARIISRSQIVFEVDIKDYVGQTFNRIDVTFNEEVTGAGKVESELAAALPTTTASYIDGFTVETAQSWRLDISVQWKNTIARDLEVDPPTESMTAPSLTLNLEQK